MCFLASARGPPRDEGPTLGPGRGFTEPSLDETIRYRDAILVHIILAVVHPRALHNSHPRGALQPFILVLGVPAHPAPRHHPPNLDLARPQIV